MADIAVVGLDIGKRLFHVIGMDQAGHVVLRRRCSRSQLSPSSSGCRRPWSEWRRVPAPTSSAAPSVISATMPG